MRRLPNADTPCLGVLGGYRVDTPLVAWLVRAGACTSTFTSGLLDSRTNEIDLGVRAVHVFDIGTLFAVDAGAGLGAAYFEQRFESEQRAATRRSGAAFGELVLGLSMDIAHGSYVTLDSSLQAYVLPMFDAVTRKTETRAKLTGHLSLGAGMRF